MQEYRLKREPPSRSTDRAPRLTIADFKEISGMGRKQSIVLLEQLDREGVTRRDGDDRVRAG